MSLAENFLVYGTLLLDITLIGTLFAFLYNRFSEEGLSRFDVYDNFTEFISDHYRELIFVQAFLATAGSLYYSNVMGYAPCRMCWFQRIFMYPLVALSGVSIFLEKKDLGDYVIPMSLIGLPIAVYHYAIQRVDQFTSAGCSVTAVSCSTEYTFHFGYITIPMMAATAFLVILIIAWKFGYED